MQTQGTIELNVVLRGKSMGDLIAAAEKFAKGAKIGGKRATATDEEVLDDETDTDEITETGDEEQMEFEMGGDDEEETLGDDEEEKPAKNGRGKKLTDKDVNQACIAHAKKFGKTKTSGILAKKFKVKSILELKPAQYADVVKALKV